MGLIEGAYLWGRSVHIRTRRQSRGDSEYSLLPHLVKKGMTAVDVGANRGVYVFPIASRASHVYAYEPSPWIAGYLAKGAPKNVTVRNCAVSDTPGTVTLRVPVRADGSLAHNKGSIERESEGGPMRSADVKAVRLDDEGLENVGFMKIDAEDHEIPVVRGAKNIITRDKPNLLIEVLSFAGNERWRPLYDELTALGYEAYVLYQGSLWPALQAERLEGVGLNVVFLPRN